MANAREDRDRLQEHDQFILDKAVSISFSTIILYSGTVISIQHQEG